MALKLALGFAIRVLGDGVDKDISISISTAAIGLKVPQLGDAAAELPPAFLLNAPMPIEVHDVQSGNNHDIQSAVISLGVLTVTYVDAVPYGEVDTIHGDLIF